MLGGAGGLRAGAVGQSLARDLEALRTRQFDLVVVGGGIFGACAAWDAILRGLRVALLERLDFGGQTSANSYKMVHGGMRYMQHADLARVRESCRERSALLRIAPHLVQTLPIVVPTYGYGSKGKPLLAAGMYGYDLLTLGRNRGIVDPDRRLPWTRLLSRSEVLAEFPALKRKALTGAVLFADGQIYNPPRLVMAFLRAAAAQGLVAANYVEATGLLRDGRRITGVRARDNRSGERLQVRGRAVLNAAGPWAEPLLRRWLGQPGMRLCTYSRDACFVVRRRSPSVYALAALGRDRDADAVLGRGARHLFVVPWRGYTLLGVWHKVYHDHPDQVDLSAGELEAWIAEINAAYPALKLTLDAVLLWHAGLLPFGENVAGAQDLSYGKRSILIDHAAAHGLDNLVTLVGIRYTMGRADAARAVDLIARKLDHCAPRPLTERLPVFGGHIDDFAALVEEARRAAPVGLPAPAIRPLVHNYGSEWRRVLAYATAESALARPLPGSTVLAAEVVHAVREEMAVALDDVVFRRTDLATGGDPGPGALTAAAELMSRELGWGAERRRAELAQVAARFPRWSLRRPTGAA